MKTADLMDKFDSELQSCETQFFNYGGRKVFYGPCRTVSCCNDNVLIRRILEEKANGDVLVIDGDGSMSTALLGDNIAGIAQANKWAGIIVYGALRDTQAISNLDIGVKALGSNPRKSKKECSGNVDIPVSFGGITIKAGDWVYSDEDGVVVSSHRLSL